MSAKKLVLEELPLESWEPTKDTLHLFSQIVGKIRLATFPPMNHWWHVTLYVSSRGLTTRAIPYGSFEFEIELDFTDQRGHIRTTRGEELTIPLEGQSVASFHEEIFAALRQLGIEAKIRAVPYDIPDVSTTPFAEDTAPRELDREWAARYWRTLSQINSLFWEFRGRFTGKSTPPHLFWHHFDLALTRFSGRPAKARDGAGRVEREAYSAEVISFGFWAGDKNVRAPAFYAYAYPAREDIYEDALQPAAAQWNPEAGMALLMYDDIRSSTDPRGDTLDFLESVYRSAGRRAGWDVASLQLDRVAQIAGKESS